MNEQHPEERIMQELAEFDNYQEGLRVNLHANCQAVLDAIKEMQIILRVAENNISNLKSNL